MCGSNRTAWLWTSVKELHLHHSRPRTRRWISPHRHSVHPTEAAVEWSSNTKCPSHSQCTHTMTVSHAEYQRGTAAFTKMHTESHPQRGTEKHKSSRGRRTTTTGYQQHTKHSQYNNHSCHSHQRKTITHTSTSTHPKRKKKQTDSLREAEAEQSHSTSPQVAVT
ncbi:uncharacterized protein TM35_000781040 [Trypanosoma theileri]|uniref:Uncharacterized protein n=1 Tax=Trypanosoma theileri TaxID=67003 RepID=A0A1X0NFK0_9TRYP|nr:uncharacterized protein TM35_000781040 [Trypanosoma theileri]ORC83136.1 hypothetical protein TM35_000781040 [Trypanosoma theileri]